MALAMGARRGCAAQAAACAAREPPPLISAESAPNRGLGPGAGPDTGSGTRSNKRRHPPASDVLPLVLACCVFFAGNVSVLFRVNEGSCFSIVETSLDVALRQLRRTVM